MESQSQILHDYKPAGRTGSRPARRLPWFVAGLGIPLVALAIVMPRTEPGTYAGASMVGIGPDSSTESSLLEEIIFEPIPKLEAPEPVEHERRAAHGGERRDPRGRREPHALRRLARERTPRQFTARTQYAIGVHKSRMPPGQPAGTLPRAMQ